MLGPSILHNPLVFLGVADQTECKAESKMLVHSQKFGQFVQQVFCQSVSQLQSHPVLHCSRAAVCRVSFEKCQRFMHPEGTNATQAWTSIQSLPGRRRELAEAETGTSQLTTSSNKGSRNTSVNTLRQLQWIFLAILVWILESPHLLGYSHGVLLS